MGTPEQHSNVEMSVSNLQQKQTIMLSLVLKRNINVDIVISAHDTGLE